MSSNAQLKYLQQAHDAQIETRFDSEFGVYWAFMNPRPRPCFNDRLLSDLRDYVRSISETGARIQSAGEEHPIRYGVLASKSPGVFNLGGDLALFRTLIHAQDRAALVAYGRRCIDDLLPWHQNCNTSMTSMALVQGDALGGGFEAALSASVLIAEESSRMGFPEILFNLFPGMGAFSFLSRKIGRKMAEEMITSGTIYSARQLYDLGVVDVITPDGTGEAAVYSYVRKHIKNVNGRQGFERARNEISPITEMELLRVVEIWADTALKLQDRDLRVMDRLIRAQVRNFEQPKVVEQRNVVPLRAIGGDD
jgi:DSF synthase